MSSLLLPESSSPRVITREQELINALDKGIDGGNLDFHEYYLVRYRGLTWDQVMMLEDCFDGEDEIMAAHKATWAQANALLIEQPGLRASSLMV
jgi:hypothetical protein